MNNYTGYVRGIDAQMAARCQAFIKISETDYIQVTTDSLSLQSALELASVKDVKVEVSYNDKGGEMVLTRVRVLDNDLPVVNTLDPKHKEIEFLAYTHYVRADFLREEGENLFGNWSSSFNAACIDLYTNKAINKNSVIRKQRVGNCSGHEIWMYEHH